jgi:succinate dehydrogenase / fumarate reductase flavoprotein subunit
MIYTPEMYESLKRVEATRSARLSETFPRLSAQEKEDLLRRFHPDFIPEAFATLQVGPNKGGKAPHELARVLQARPVISPDFDVTRTDIETDILVIGGGGAGSAAALMAEENGARVVLVTKLRHGDANTMMAQGGIQAADKPNDSPAIHYLDVMGGGHYANDPDLVEALVLDAPKVIQWLEELGCMFDKEPDGTMITIHGGGTSRKRMHSARDYSGAEIMRTLRDEVRNRSGIFVLEFTAAVELILDDRGQCVGAVLLNMETEEYLVARAKCTVLATGGSGRLHYQGFATTNHYGATGDGLVLAYRAGAHLLHIDTMQYHPTGAAFPEQILGFLVTEKVRGLGAQVLNVDGVQFVNPRETRDVESAAIIRECRERGKGVRTPSGFLGVWLDSPMIELIHGPGTVARELPAMVRQFARFGVDITKEPMLVYPTLHYQNGGIKIDVNGATEIPNLFAAGEVVGGIHGRNRLMGNSLLDITVFGRRAGIAAAKRAREVQPGRPTLQHLVEWERQLQEAGLDPQDRAPILLPNYVGQR